MSGLTPQDIYSEIAIHHHNKKAESVKQIDLQCKRDLETAERDAHQTIVTRYHTKKADVTSQIDFQCKQKIEDAQNFYMSMFNVYRAAKIGNKSDCSIKICQLEDLDKVPSEETWASNINETNKKLIACFTDHLTKSGKAFTMEFNIETVPGGNPTYSCYKELHIKMK